MKMPKSPPDVSNFDEAIKSGKMYDILQVAFSGEGLGRNQYPHWDKLRHRRPPKDLSSEEWWFALKIQRSSLQKELPLVGKDGEPFKYHLPDPAPENLHKIDLGAGGVIEVPDPITNPETRDRYIVASLIEEAFTSSQLEGAASTREVAKEMIRTGRKPETEGEQMILNNYKTMRWIRKLKDKPLSHQMVCDIHRKITEGTLENHNDAGRLRKPDRPVVVDDSYGTILHDPPSADQLQDRMATMCDFANGEVPKHFIHPVVRSIMLHFWLAYDHPFVDGNGRTARALFYWSMLKHKLFLFEYISISTVILQAPIKYGRAFLYTETDNNDLTYFILYHLKIINQAITELHEYVRSKAREVRIVESRLKGISNLNHRQRTLIVHALRHPNYRYTFASHMNSNDIVYETSRADLIDLEHRDLLNKRKVGRTYNFYPASDLQEKLTDL